MKRFVFIFRLLGLIILTGCNSNQMYRSSEAFKPGQRPARLNRQVTAELDYLLYLPQGYDTKKTDWPLLVFLHGVGERGDDLELVKQHGPPKLVAAGKNLPFIIVSPQCPERLWWPSITGKVMALIDETVENYDVDESRIYLTGLSMGGYGTWAIGCTYPERFAAIAPVCGGGKTFVAECLKSMPVWAFHGANDLVVSPGESKEMVDAINKAGGNAKMTIYPNTGHDSWTKTYNNEELYSWLLSHSKKTK